MGLFRTHQAILHDTSWVSHSPSRFGHHLPGQCGTPHVKAQSHGTAPLHWRGQPQAQLVTCAFWATDCRSESAMTHALGLTNVPECLQNSGKQILMFASLRRDRIEDTDERPDGGDVQGKVHGKGLGASSTLQRLPGALWRPCYWDLTEASSHRHAPPWTPPWRRGTGLKYHASNMGGPSGERPFEALSRSPPSVTPLEQRMLLVLFPALAQKHASLCLGSRETERSPAGVMAYDPTKPPVTVYQESHPTKSPIRSIFWHPHPAAHTHLLPQHAPAQTCLHQAVLIDTIYTREGFVYAIRCIENRSRTWLSGCWSLLRKFACWWKSGRTLR